MSRSIASLLFCATLLRLCVAQNGVCYVTASQVSTQSYYVQTSYTYYYDCSNFGWGWSYCSAIGYTSSLTYASVTAYVAQFTCCTGYTQVGTTQTCADINECAPNGGLGPCQQNCTNTIGSYYCSCQPGYALSADGANCTDINECAPNGGLGPCQQLCTNTIGSYYCSCQPGYALSADGTSCNDINECAPNGGLGPCQQLCTNTNGSYYCSCQPGYALSANGTSCNDINECAPNGGLGPCQQLCTNTIGSYYCSCQPGYALSVDGTSCNDTNECASNGGLGPCQQNCTNTIGSFVCNCLNGYIISVDNTSCQASPSSLPSSSAGYLQSINPTAATTVTSVVTLPAVTQSPSQNVYVQVRLLNVTDCSSWNLPAALTVLCQSINNNVNGFCKCNFSVANAEVICYDVTRVTLRGTVEAMQLPYLQDWVANEATTISPYGILLKVDNGCPVKIQSLNVPECAVANVSVRHMSVQRSLALTVGLSVGGVAITILITAGAVVIVFYIKSVKSSTGHWITNPLYQQLHNSTYYNATSDCEVEKLALHETYPQSHPEKETPKITSAVYM